jgi:DNA-binding SARP family transcriptional activator/tetratricopeptide (TPR) repeat protein
MEFNETDDVKIYLLGRFEVIRGKKKLRAIDWKRQKAASLLKWLAWERKLLKEVIMEYLWPNAGPTRGANNLYRALYDVRRTLDTFLGEGSADQILSFSDGVLTLSESIGVDAHEYEQAGKRRDFQYLTSNYPGDLLPDDLYEDWTQTPREYLFQFYREAILSLAREDPATAAGLLIPLLEKAPLDESIHRALMRAYALTGRRHHALRQYHNCVEVLDREMGIAPDAQTMNLFEQILQGEMVTHPPEPSRSGASELPVVPILAELEKDSTFAGREKEFESLLQRIQAAKDGNGNVILLAGNTGVGKTRLAFELLRAASSLGMSTLLGTCHEQEGQLPYQPFIEGFRRYLSDQGLPLDQNPILNFKRSGTGDLQQEQWMLFKETAAFLHEITQQEPAVFLVDDLHAADETSLSLFHFLARQTRSTPLILLATYREDIPSTKIKPVEMLLNSLYRERLAEQLNIKRLGREAVAGIITSILTGEPEPSLVRSIFEITEGNPFFVQEVTQSLRADGLVERANGLWRLSSGGRLPIPSKLNDLLLERVAHLGEQVETILIAGAILGREFRFDLVYALSGLSDGEALDALDLALASRLLDEVDDGYRFRHSLIRQTLYESLSQARRAHLHGRAAEGIKKTFSSRQAGLDPHVEALAYHYLRSTQREQALPYLLRAGEQAASVYALEVSIRHYEEALSLMDAFHLDDPAQRWRIHESLGWWYDTLADIPRAVGHFEQALQIPSSKEWESGHRDRARVHRAAATVLITGGQLDQGEAHLEAALLEVDETEDASDYALVLYTLSQYYWHKNEFQEAFDAAQKSMDIAERLDDQVALANAFEMLALTCHSLGEWQSGLQFERQRASLEGHELDVTSAFDVHL